MSQGLWAWSKGRRPSGAVLHSSREPGVQRHCSDFMDMLRHLINCRIIIIIIINIANTCRHFFDFSVVVSPWWNLKLYDIVSAI